FHSADGRDVVQFRNDGFTYNRLAPYTSGDAVIEEALRVWPAYLEVLARPDVKRIAMRYINRMEGVEPSALVQWLAHPPIPPQGPTGSILGFCSRVKSVDPSSGHRLIAATRFEPPMGTGAGGVLFLDLDAFALGDFVIDEIRPTLTGLRE